MKAFTITVVSIFVSFIASLVNLPWVAGLAALVALAGAYAQYQDTAPFVYLFSENSWQQLGNREFNLVIPKSQHRKNSPIATVYKGKTPGFSEVGVGINTNSDGTVVVEAALTFEGKLVIK